MLLQFHFRHFRSFSGDVYLDLSATKINELDDHVVRLGGEKVLSTAAVWGANASGKSNLLRALDFMCCYVRESFAYTGEQARERHKERYEQNVFRFSEAGPEEGMLFEVFWIDEQANCKTINYGFVIDRDGIREEWLGQKAKTAKVPKMVFYRDRDELDLSGLPQNCRENLRSALEAQVLLLSLGSRLKIEGLKKAASFFDQIYFSGFDHPFRDRITEDLFPVGFVEDTAVQREVAQYLASFDASIQGFQVQVIRRRPDGLRELLVQTLHRAGGEVERLLPLEDESDGTLQMLALYPKLKRVFDEGAVLCVDELHARLHPLLIRILMLSFKNQAVNPNHAQLICTLHDSWHMDNGTLRRDEIWFTDKNEAGESSLYSLADFRDQHGDKIRKDENYMKNYLVGKYGGIPDLQWLPLKDRVEEH